MATVGFLGTGCWGGAMVEGMLRRGDTVTVWNRTESKARALEQMGAVVAATPGRRGGCRRARPPHSCGRCGGRRSDGGRPSAAQPGRDRHGPLDHVAARHESAPRADAGRRGVKFLHAPVFMSPQMARDGVGIMLASGPQAVLDDALDDLEGMTGEVWYLGEQGDLAAAYKIFGNSMLLRDRRRGSRTCSRWRRDSALRRPTRSRCFQNFSRAASSSRAARRWLAATSAPRSS